MTARCRLAAEPGSVGVARAAVRGYLESNGVVDAESAVLLVSELVANAVVHPSSAGASPIELEVDLRQGCLHIEVQDGDPRPPVPRPHRPEDEYGRGLMIVDRLADAWGWWPVDGDGKRVWCDLRTRTRPPVAVAGAPRPGRSSPPR